MINIIVVVETPTYQLDEHTDDIMRLVNLGVPKTLMLSNTAVLWVICIISLTE